MTRRRYRYDKSQGRVVEVFAVERPLVHTIITDAYYKNPVRSPVDGTLIDDRTALKAHNRRHDVVDVGNDPVAIRPRAPIKPEGVGDDIRTAIQQIEQNHEHPPDAPAADFSEARILNPEDLP